jgi:hypothetical protein
MPRLFWLVVALAAFQAGFVIEPESAHANWRNRDILTDPGPADATPIVLDSLAVRIEPAQADVKLLQANGKRSPTHLRFLAVSAQYVLRNPTAEEVAVTLVAHYPHRCDPGEQETPEAQAVCHDDRAAAVDFLQLQTKVQGKPLQWKQGTAPGTADFAQTPGHTWLAVLRFAPGQQVKLEHRSRVQYGPSLTPRVSDQYYNFAAANAWAETPKTASVTVILDGRPNALYAPASWPPAGPATTVAGPKGARLTTVSFALAGKDLPATWWLRASHELEELKGIADFCPPIYDGSEGGGIEPTLAADLAEQLTADKLRQCRNWSSARWGYTFADKGLQEHFYRPAGQVDKVADLEVSGPSWRIGLAPNPSYSAKLLTKEDKRDAALYQKAEQVQKAAAPAVPK